MHKKNTQRLSKLISTAGILAVLFGGLVAQSVRAVSSNPTPVCVGSTCTVTFEASGDYHLWNPPIGAKNISFDLMGAQGGRSGGLGGRITGNLASVPSVLYIYVGGAGSQGAGAQGGFNGGGNAGNGRGDEGSGGGATDIRSTTSINDRIAIAGGGGGSGGYSGGSGGAAGGLSGSSGTSGQGQGGSGATQSSGGNGGYPNGGSWGGTGDFGIGGTGGSSSVSGGGGGGGGFYGGGGGGADIDTCCSNAGGGGGGSSWAHSVQATSVSHTGGYRSGAGVAIISYSVPPSVTTFATYRNLTNENSISYNLEFNETVSGLTNTDLLTTGSTATCNAISISGSAKSYVVTVSGCDVGTLKLTLLANSISGALPGPAIDKVSADVVIERTLPLVSVTAPSSPNAAQILQYSLQFSEAITGLASDDFMVSGSGCQVGDVSGSEASYTVEIISCNNAASAQLNLAANSVVDLAGNLGPASALDAGAVLIDRAAPIGTWVTAAATSASSPVFEINFAESVTGLAANDFLMIGAATDCILAVTEETIGLKFKIETSGCSDGTVQVLMNANSYSDALGNTGPVLVSASAVTTKAAIPVAAPSQTPTPTPTPTPAASTAPVVPPSAAQPTSPAAPEPPTAPDSKATKEPALESRGELVLDDNQGNQLVAAQPVRKTYALTPSVETDPESIVESQDSYPVNESQITVQNPTAAKPIVATNSRWQAYASLGLGVIALAFASVGLIKAARQMRARRLVRRFA